MMLLKRWRLHDEEGQGLVEYALIIMLVALAVFAGLTLFGTTLNNTYTTIQATLPF